MGFMKRVVLQMDSPEDSKLASQALGSLSGVMITSVQGNALVIHCGQRLDSNTLINKLHEYGLNTVTAEEARESFF
jgi:hypothetical protein